MKEWLLEKVYEKPNGIVSNVTLQSSGLIHEITHISKGIGFDHVTPFITPKSETSPKKNLDSLEFSKISLKQIDNEENLEDERKFYDCVYIIVSSHPVSTFPQN